LKRKGKICGIAYGLKITKDRNCNKKRMKLGGHEREGRNKKQDSRLKQSKETKKAGEECKKKKRARDKIIQLQNKCKNK
jgi:hypothetical protein